MFAMRPYLRRRGAAAAMLTGAMLVAGLLVVGLASERGVLAAPDAQKMPEESEPAFTLHSSAFEPGEPIPKMYTADGQDISPPLHWEHPPEGMQSYALIVDDPDAPTKTWVHWVLYNLPPEQLLLKEDVPPKTTLPSGAFQGVNDFGRLGYGGPAPPPGAAHRYFFKLYALDTTLPEQKGATKAELLRAMEGHVLGEAQLIGTYSR